ncbi:MAG: HNH endonuclease [Treponemataceae bacterium]|nr:HNH endonuclease [Treponemataceae bacterium]
MANWTREEEIVVFDLYCKIPFQRSSKNHPDVIRIANIIGRSPSAVNMKIGNFGSFDESLRKQGIVGLGNASKLDKEIWDEFNEHWDELSLMSEQIISQMSGRTIQYTDTLSHTEDMRFDIPLGKERNATIKQRVNQTFFRKAVLASYNSTCCVTGLSVENLMIASHIKPWSVCTETERTNPHNGLCLNALHDKAFDRGLMTITPDGKIHISNKLKSIHNDALYEYFVRYDNKAIRFPEKFMPDKIFLEYHNDMIFEK